MIKNKLDFKLINLAIWVFIIYLFLQTKDMWMEVVLIIKKILLPFFLSFILAYIMHPILIFLKKLHIPKIIGIILIIIFIITIIILGSIYLIPSLIHQLIDITSNLIIFIKSFSNRFNLNYNKLIAKLKKDFLFMLKYDIFNIGEV